MREVLSREYPVTRLQWFSVDAAVSVHNDLAHERPGTPIAARRRRKRQTEIFRRIGLPSARRAAPVTSRREPVVTGAANPDNRAGSGGIFRVIRRVWTAERPHGRNLSAATAVNVATRAPVLDACATA